MAKRAFHLRLRSGFQGVASWRQHPESDKLASRWLPLTPPVVLRQTVRKVLS